MKNAENIISERVHFKIFQGAYLQPKFSSRDRKKTFNLKPRLGNCKAKERKKKIKEKNALKGTFN